MAEASVRGELALAASRGKKYHGMFMVLASCLVKPSDLPRQSHPIKTKRKPCFSFGVACPCDPLWAPFLCCHHTVICNLLESS